MTIHVDWQSLDSDGNWLELDRINKMRLQSDAFDPGEDRDEYGRWTSGESGDVTAFHGTTADVAQQILKEGIKIGGSQRSFAVRHPSLYSDERGHSVYVADDPLDALRFAQFRSLNLGKMGAVVFEVHIPHDEWRKFKEDEQNEFTARRAEFNIPPAWIVKATEYDANDLIGETGHVLKKDAAVVVKFLTVFARPHFSDYDPNEARDADWDESKHPRGEHGRWATGEGSTEIAPTWEVSPAFLAEAERVARNTAAKLNFDEKLVRFSGAVPTFELNGKKYNMAGSYTPGRDDVELYLRAPYLSAQTVPGLTAHEIMHRKYQAFLDDVGEETRKVMAEAKPQEYAFHEHPLYKPLVDERIKWARIMQNYDLPKEERAAAKVKYDIASAVEHTAYEAYKTQPLYFPEGDPVMKPDGSLREPYAAKYPLYQKWNEINENHAVMADADGVSPYSEEYWKEYHTRGPRGGGAFTETLAEMARIELEAGGKEKNALRRSILPGRRMWWDLYDAINTHWSRKRMGLS